jgi:hypothetical protein
MPFLNYGSVVAEDDQARKNNWRRQRDRKRLGVRNIELNISVLSLG